VLIVIAMMAMLCTSVQTMDPMVVFIPIPWDPNHFIVLDPIMRTMGVIRPVADFDSDLIRSDSGRKNNARGSDRDEP
jgi:hypothetical protein